jgi:glutamate/tyrosine decarboxylase-like PLP-dependent enzyme
MTAPVPGIPGPSETLPGPNETLPGTSDGSVPATVWFSEYGLEQTRPFRALKVWMQLRHLGRDGTGG